MTRSQRIPSNLVPLYCHLPAPLTYPLVGFAVKALKALTLHADRMTTSRRTSPVPQLTCEGKACRTYQPDVVQCQAVGDDGPGGLEWSCTAELPKGVRFGAVEVGCEGWGECYLLLRHRAVVFGAGTNLGRSHRQLG